MLISQYISVLMKKKINTYINQNRRTTVLNIKIKIKNFIALKFIAFLKNNLTTLII